MRKIKFAVLLAAITVMCFPAYAEATFSDNWKQGSDGEWHVYDEDDQLITNAWFCDDAVESNGKNVWYLLDKSGNMVSAGLVQDGTGNYYSLETEHNGYYGMLRYKSGTYDGIDLELESSHSGSFAAIKNTDGVAKLKAKYGLKVVDIDNNNIYYSSEMKKVNVMNDGWVEPNDGNKYYYKNGSVLKGWQTIGNKTYYFDETTGALYSNRYTPDGYFISSDGTWDGKEAVTDTKEQEEQLKEKIDEEADIALTWDEEAKTLLNRYKEKAVSSLQNANTLVAEAKGISDRKQASKKYYAAAGKASSALEYMEYMMTTLEMRPAYMVSGVLATTALQNTMNKLKFLDSFEITDTTDITSAAFQNQFSVLGEVINSLNTIAAAAK